MENKKDIIKREVEQQVIFKLNEFKTVLMNTNKWTESSAWNSRLSVAELKDYIAKSDIENNILAILDKEIQMTFPMDMEMEYPMRKRLHSDVVDKIVNEFERLTRGYLHPNQRMIFLKHVLQQTDRML